MHLVLDTNVLHQENLSSANMKTLLRLVESGHVTICIPELVRREYITKIISECTTKLQSASSHLESVGRIARISRTTLRVSEAQAEIGRLRSEVADAYEADFSRWSETYRVQELPFESEMIVSVLNDYFEGATPYRSQKSREDILDSMIGKSIDALAGSVGNVGVIVKDGMFRRHLEQQGRAQVFESVEQFLLLEQSRAELNRLDIELNMGALTATLSDAKGALAEFAKGSQRLLDTIYLEEDGVTGVDVLDMECFGVRVNGPKVGDVTSLQLDQFEYLGKGQFAAIFVMDAKAQIDYCASYMDYLENERESVEMTSMNGVGICDFEEFRLVRITGKLILNIGQDGNIDAAQATIATGAFHDESLEFEAATAALLSP